jgi:hypothetical protein
MSVELRHYCRNPRCRTKLSTLVENEHHAFCIRGCYESLYRNRCRVCERDLRKTASAVTPTGSIVGRRETAEPRPANGLKSTTMGSWSGFPRITSEVPILRALNSALGFILARGRAGFEAFDSEERSLGVYGTQREAAAAIMRGSP